LASQPLPVPLHDVAALSQNSPAVLVVDDDTTCVSHCTEMLDELGYRHYGSTTARHALECLGQDPAIQILLASIQTPSMKGLALVEEVRARAGDARPIATILVADNVTTELAMKAVHLEAVDVLAKPLGFDAYAAALRRAMRFIALRRPQSDNAMGQQLARLISALELKSPLPIAGQIGADKDVSATLRAIIASRGLRTRYFPADMFADPAWDILLDLARADVDKQQVSVSSVCIAASVPMSTALRWVRLMTEAGLLSRWTDPKDRRRDLIALTDQTAANMREYLNAVQAMLKKV